LSTIPVVVSTHFRSRQFAARLTKFFTGAPLAKVTFRNVRIPLYRSIERHTHKSAAIQVQAQHRDLHRERGHVHWPGQLGQHTHSGGTHGLTPPSLSTPERTPLSPSATSCPSPPSPKVPSLPTSRTRPPTVVRLVVLRATTLPSSATTLMRARPVSSSHLAPRRSFPAHAVVWSESSLEVAEQTNPS